jgi:hypothetical protein
MHVYLSVFHSPRQLYFDLSASVRRIAYFDIAAVTVDDSVRNRQSQTRSLRFGRIKGVEDPLQPVFADARSVIRDGNQYVLYGRRLNVYPDEAAFRLKQG